MTTEQAYQNIEAALNMATSKGAFSLAEVQIILASLETIKPVSDGKAKGK